MGSPPDKLILSASLLLLVAASGVIGWPRYQQNRQAAAVRQAQAFLARGDLPNASLSARRILRQTPRNIEACAILADLAEAGHSPAALEWRQRVTTLSPSLANRLRLAATALRYERPPYALAARTLVQLEPLAAKVPAFHALSAELALKLNRFDEAVVQFEEAARLEPNNQWHRFDRAVLQLAANDSDVAVAARRTLEELSTNRALRLPALRWRMAESLGRGDVRGAGRLSDELLNEAGACWPDRLEHASILQRAGDPSFREYLGLLQINAATNAVVLYATAQWMGRHGLAEEALTWLNGLDSRRRQAQPVPLALAQLLLAKSDWSALEKFLQRTNWAELEFLRLAYLAQAAAGQGQAAAAAARWRTAVDAAAGRLEALNLLLGLAAEWKRDCEEVLWAIGRRFPRERWALNELEKRYLAAGDTRALNQVYGALAGAPGGSADFTNRNNFATSSLLLGLNLTQAHEIARQLYRQKPDDPVIGSTYAYSLHLQGRTADGLAVFDKLGARALQTPSLALYYGVLLSSAGRSEPARRYLELAERAPLFPEERQLLQRARQGLTP